MVDAGDQAPDFTAPYVTPEGEVESFRLADRLDEAPIVLAFFPAAFTGTCTNEMASFRDRIDEFRDAGATVYGVSVDTPFSLKEFAAQNELPFGLVSDADHEAVEAYGVATPMLDLGIDVASRSVFVVDRDGTVTYRWVGDELGVEPDYEAVREAAVAAAD